MAGEETIKWAKEEMKAQINAIVDAQDKSKEEKEAIKELYSFMMSLGKEELKKIHGDPRYIEAANKFKQDNTSSEIVINACHSIINGTNE